MKTGTSRLLCEIFNCENFNVQCLLFRHFKKIFAPHTISWTSWPRKCRMMVWLSTSIPPWRWRKAGNPYFPPFIVTRALGVNLVASFRHFHEIQKALSEMDQQILAKQNASSGWTTWSLSLTTEINIDGTLFVCTYCQYISVLFLE